MPRAPALGYVLSSLRDWENTDEPQVKILRSAPESAVGNTAQGKPGGTT
jgi:hypothetical protein